MKHKIEIRRYDAEPDAKGYYGNESIFEQVVEDLDVPAVIAVVNNLTKKRRRQRGKKEHANLI